MGYTEELIEKLEGKTIVTSDQGNLFGERIPPLFIREYGHHCRIYTKNLIKVPWFAVNKSNRKEIKKDEVKFKKAVSNNFEEKEIKEKLKSLGYI